MTCLFTGLPRGLRTSRNDERVRFYTDILACWIATQVEEARYPLFIRHHEGAEGLRFYDNWRFLDLTYVRRNDGLRVCDEFFNNIEDT